MTVLVRAVVFDLDGILIDSEPIWDEVRRHFVTREGGTWYPDSQQRMMGMSTSEWSGYLSTRLQVRLQPSEIAARVIEAMAERYGSRPPLIEGAAEAVRALAARWPLALASSSPRLLIDRVLASSGLDRLFVFSISTEELKRGKPAPDVYLRSAARFGLAPAECVAIEDSVNGVASALAAGMRVIAIPDLRYPLDRSLLEHVDATLKSIRELTAAIIAGL
jgi:HAD superfamily hydrolase (TIGR01509 family)